MASLIEIGPVGGSPSSLTVVWPGRWGLGMRPLREMARTSGPPG